MTPARRGGPRRRGPADGDVAVFVADEQAQHLPVDVERWRTLAEAVLVDEGVAGDVELTLLFVDEPTIAELNRSFLGGTGPTDVLSFPIDGELVDPGRSPDGGTPGPQRELPPVGDLPLLLGDIVICPTVAAANAPIHAGSVDDELALLVVHGILHLLGHDHVDAAERARMWDRERELLAARWGPLAADPWAALAAEGFAGTTEVGGTTGAGAEDPGPGGSNGSTHPAGGPG